MERSKKTRSKKTKTHSKQHHADPQHYTSMQGLQWLEVGYDQTHIWQSNTNQVQCLSWLR